MVGLRLPLWEHRYQEKNHHAESGLARKPQLQSSDADLIKSDARVLEPPLRHRLPLAERNEAKEDHIAMDLVAEI